LKEHDPVARIHFCNWFHQSVHDGEVDPQLVFFSYKPWFSLCGEVNSQNNQFWSAENPGLIHELPLHGEKTGVWCVMSAPRLIGPIFYNNTVNAVRYTNNFLHPFFIELTEEKKAIRSFPARFCSGIWHR
jgi:hypothetical protein